MMCFSLFGFTTVGFMCYLLIIIPLLYHFQIEAGLVPITVLVTHLIAKRVLHYLFYRMSLCSFL